MSGDPRAALALAFTRLAVVPRWRITSAVLAAVLLAVPLATPASNLPVQLAYGQIEAVALIGLAAGWILLDRLTARRMPRGGMAILVAAIVALGWLTGGAVLVRLSDRGETLATILALSFVGGGLVRGVTIDRRSMASLVGLAGAASWLSYDIAWLPYQPLRDIHLYLDAGARALNGASPYAQGPVRSVGNLERLPFVYPPPTIPLFEFLASLPRPVADTMWVAGSSVAVIAALWLLGVRGRWLLVLLAWPPFAVGIAVGNVASFTFLLYAAGFRAGVALVLSGAFKPQSTISALWLVREWRWRPIAAGIGIGAAIVLITVPLTGLHAWVDWLDGLRYFQESFRAFPWLQGGSLTYWLGANVALAATVAAIGFALLGRGRNGLARFGVASVVASPTLSIHGLSPALAGAFVLGPELLWFVLGLGAWRIESTWLAVAIVGLAVLVARDDDLCLPRDLPPSRADMHPLAASSQVWPVELSDEVAGTAARA